MTIGLRAKMIEVAINRRLLSEIALEPADNFCHIVGTGSRLAKALQCAGISKINVQRKV